MTKEILTKIVNENPVEFIFNKELGLQMYYNNLIKAILDKYELKKKSSIIVPGDR